MPRLATPATEERRRPEPPSERDRFAFSLKVATFVVATASVGVILLLDGGASDDGWADPGVPTIIAPSDAAEAGPAEPRSAPTTTAAPTSPMVVPPVQRAETTAVVPMPSASKPPESTPPTRTRPRSGNRFVVLGTPCKRPGAYAFTARYEPAVCERNGRRDEPTWQLVG